MKDLEMDSWSCSVGWPVQGLAAATAAASGGGGANMSGGGAGANHTRFSAGDVVAVCRSNAGDVLAVRGSHACDDRDITFF